MAKAKVDTAVVVSPDIQAQVDAAIAESRKFKPTAGEFVVVRGGQPVMSHTDRDLCQMRVMSLKDEMHKTGHDLTSSEHTVRLGQMFTTEDGRGEIRF